jgi:iron complex outermembrane receptor protein
MALRARREGAADAAVNGLAPVNVPARSLRAELGWAAATGLELSAALAHESSRVVLADHSASIPGWTRIDLGAKVDQRWGDTRVTWRAAVDNVGDRRAWKESPFQFGHAYLFPLAPRSLRLSAQFEL